MYVKPNAGKIKTDCKVMSYSGHWFQVALFGFEVDDGPVDRVQIFPFDGDSRAATDQGWGKPQIKMNKTIKIKWW